MSQFLSQVPRQLLQQQQRLTPQLIQAMDILQLSTMALEARINQELDSNPALELVAPDGEADNADEPAAPAEPPEGETEPALTVAEGGGPEDFQRLDNLVREYDVFEEDGYRGTKTRAQLDEEGDQKLDALANTAARPVSLRDYLLEQWHLIDTDDATRAIGAAIIDNMDDNGRLTSSLDEIAAGMSPAPPRDAMEQGLRLVQTLDPPGVGARSLQECLLLQLEAQPGNHGLAKRIVAEHLDDLEHNRLPQIAKALRVELEDVKEALETIKRLSLHPGQEVVDRGAPAIMPDVVVEYDEGADRYTARLTRGNLRELRISQEFREALEQTRDNKPAREFIRQKIEAAAALIEAVRYRRERLLEVAMEVVEAQRDFIERGDQYLRILRMSDLADRFGCDPSTISRTVDGKWIQIPRGVFPLRRFFTGGTESQNGEALGWESIRAKVQEIVEQEDKSDPLSDDAIVEKLKAQGIEIKRRTVAKYRSQLHIPTARQRRKF